MVTPAQQAALEEIKRLSTSIEESQSDLRVLERINAPNTMELRNNLANAIRRRDELVLAIDAEKLN